jgi:hypothetical protein
MSQSRTAAQNATATAVRNGACIINRVRVRQYAGAAPRLYLQLFNTNAPTVGTTAPEMVIPVPAGNTKMNATVRDVNFTGDRRAVWYWSGVRRNDGPRWCSCSYCWAGARGHC